MSKARDLRIETLLSRYRKLEITPRQVITTLLDRLRTQEPHNAWIHIVDDNWLEPMFQRLEENDPDALPLYGIPFAIKDNIDLAGVPTSAACPDYSYTPTQHAHVVALLIEAGAIPLGKTNMDQFATGLVGTRSPHGACRNPYNPDFISGGSSSGSAVAVSTDSVSFSLGTDTAGSGRVPAAFCNIIGFKPSCGLLSNSGVVPACKSLDSVSVFAKSADCIRQLVETVCHRGANYDESDPYARRIFAPLLGSGFIPQKEFHFGVPKPSQLQFFDDAEAERLFRDKVVALQNMGGIAHEIDFSAFLDTARLLYEGPWVAERYAAVGEFIDANPDGVDATVRAIISPGKNASAVETFNAMYRLQALKHDSSRVWDDVDFMVTPTTGTVFRINEVNADPVTLNTQLGYYTNFMNLLDLCAIAVPAGFRSAGEKAGLPFGITLFAPAGYDQPLVNMTARLQGEEEDTVLPENVIQLAVCGAHMQGLPLNWQLTSRRGRLLKVTESAPEYRFYKLPGGPPERPGMVRVGETGASIRMEIWSLPVSEFGSFVAGIPAPLAIGKVRLIDGTEVPGFVCEAAAVTGAQDITHLADWRKVQGSPD